jgi:2-methylisocitrate lyase-like PEP mutase family enzyme
VVRAVAPKPVNVLIGPGVQLADLADAGVRHVSLGAILYRRAMGGLAMVPGVVRGAVLGSDLIDLLAQVVAH